MKKFLIAINLVIWSTLSWANAIDEKCPHHVVWGAPKLSQEGNNQYLCRLSYAVNYNYATKVAHYVVERITPDKLIKSVARKDDFREDPEVPAQFRSTLKDYAGAGYDRGHMAPAADMTFSAQAMSESFFLSNMMPQVPGNNRGIWKYTEELTRYYAQKYGEVFAITGTIYEPNAKFIGNGVYVPNYIYKIVIEPRGGKAIAFLYPNQKLDPKEIEKYIVSIKELEQYTGIDFSPAIPQHFKVIEEQRANFKDW